MSEIPIRMASEADLPAILAIYNEVIANTTAVYSEEETTLEERTAWFRQKVAEGWPVLVAVAEEVVGFASFGPFRAWACYAATVEHSVHVRADQRGRGIGRGLVLALIANARERGLHVMVAGIDASNEGSINLHRKLGFVDAGTLREVGRKFGRWLDLRFMQIDL